MAGSQRESASSVRKRPSTEQQLDPGRDYGSARRFFDGLIFIVFIHNPDSDIRVARNVIRLEAGNFSDYAPHELDVLSEAGFRYDELTNDFVFDVYI
jgi:hypothetical protein